MNYAYKSHLVKSLFPALTAGLATGVVNYFVIQPQPVSFISGMLMGVSIYSTLYLYFNFYHKRLMYKIPIYADVFVSAVLIIIAILFWVSVFLLIFNVKNWSGVLPYLISLFKSPGVALGVIFGLIISFGFNLFLSVQEIIGARTLGALFLGVYSQPREVHRIFMFLDIQSSTSIAERLGNEQFLNFLNDFFFIASEGISQSKGIIYKYVGDEVILTWTLRRGLRNSNAVRCFFLIEKAIEERSAFFQKKYGLTPCFKAGLHAGKVIAGELGFRKKEITYIGEVLNTTARIEGICNDLNQRLLISKGLRQKLTNNHYFTYTSMGKVKLRGMQKNTELFSVAPRDY